jgi:membrane protease YdiL (CAAX protease family)
MIENVFKDFIAFLRNPNEERDFNRSAGFKLKVIFKLFLFELPFIFVFGVIMSFLRHFKLVDPGTHKGLLLLAEYSYLQVLLIMVLAGPFFEEIMFRLPLRYKGNYLARLVVFCISKTGFFPEEKLNENVQKFRNASFKYFFYFLTLAFGFIHLTNYQNYKALILFVPVLTMTQIVGGSIMGYIRIRYGFIWGYFYHAFFNFVFMSMAFAAQHPASHAVHDQASIYSFKNEHVSVKIENCQFQGGDDTRTAEYSTITANTINFSRIRLNGLVSALFMRQDKYVITNNLNFSHFYNVTSSYSNQGQNSGSPRQILLDHLQKAFNIAIEKKVIKLGAWELYVMDSLKFQRSSSKGEYMEANGNLKKLAKYLDRTYKKEYIFSPDTIHQASIIIPSDTKFDQLPEYLKSEYGLGLRRVTKELEFISISPASKKGS